MKIKRVCLHCGKEFYQHAKYVKRGKGKFYSISCGVSHRNYIDNPAKREDVKRKLAERCSHPTHGLARTRLYRIWRGIKDRCFNKNYHGFRDYGGRGITVCQEWLLFEPFRDWALSNGYAENLTIDRINNDGNYEPSNCRWATRFQQMQNTRKNKRFNGKTLREWVDISGIPYYILFDRTKRGWDIERAISKPVQKRRKG